MLLQKRKYRPSGLPCSLWNNRISKRLLMLFLIYGFRLLSNDGHVASFQSDNGTLVTYSIYSGQSDPEITVSTTAKPGEIEKILTSSGFSKVRTSNHQTKSDNPQPTTKNGQPITTYEKGSRLHPKSTVCTFLKGSPTILTFRKHSNL